MEMDDGLEVDDDTECCHSVATMQGSYGELVGLLMGGRVNVGDVEGK